MSKPNTHRTVVRTEPVTSTTTSATSTAQATGQSSAPSSQGSQSAATAGASPSESCGRREFPGDWELSMSQLVTRRIALRVVQFVIAAAGILFLLLLLSRQAHAATDDQPAALSGITSAVTAPASTVAPTVTAPDTSAVNPAKSAVNPVTNAVNQERPARDPARIAAQKTAQKTAQEAAARARIIFADHERLIVTYSSQDDAVYVFTPPGEDPGAVLRAARLILPEDRYEELAGHLGLPSAVPLE